MSYLEQKAAREFNPGDVIFREKDEGNSMFIIQSGEVEISAIKDKKKVVYAKLGKGAIFGEMALIDGHPRSATVTALTRTNCIEMSRMLFQKNLEGLQPWMRSFFQIMAERLREANKRADSMTQRDHSRQVIMILSNILNNMEPNALDEVVTPWKPLVKDISLVLNLPYDTVDKVLNKVSLTEMAKSEMNFEHGRVFIMKDMTQFKFFADYCKSRFLEKEGSEIPTHFQKMDEREEVLVQFLHKIMREQRWEPEVEQHYLEERFQEEVGKPISEFVREMKMLRTREIITSKLDQSDVKMYSINKDKLQEVLSIVDTLNEFAQVEEKL